MKKIIWSLGGVLLLIGAIASAGPSPSKSNGTASLNTDPTSSVQEAAPDTTNTAAAAAAAAPAPTPSPAPEPTPAPASNCNPNYSPCIPNVSYDLDCPDIGHRVTVTGSDPYRLDADNDGIGCESY